MVYVQKAKRDPVKFQEDFESFKVGEHLRLGLQNAYHPPLFVMADIPGAKGKCLEFRDGPDQAQLHKPHFYCNPSHTEGTTRVAFDLRREPSYRFSHEWRDASSPYKTGVYFFIENSAIIIWREEDRGVSSPNLGSF